MPNRQSIIDFARQYIGSHYLWGAGGSVPEQTDGVWYRRDAVKLQKISLDANKPSVYAATCKASNEGLHVCAGRFMQSGGRVSAPGAGDLRGYLDTLLCVQTSPDKGYPAFCLSYYPRLVTGKTVPQRIVWGEDCRGKRHFDCVSFVNFVMSCTTKVSWSAGIPLWSSPGLGTTGVTDTTKVLPGDILLRHQTHIAIVTEKGGRNYVIQAEDHANGVHEDDIYIPSQWTSVRRIPDAYLMN